MKTPEGIYKIDRRNPQSSFHLALYVSYPSGEDKLISTPETRETPNEHEKSEILDDHSSRIVN